MEIERHSNCIESCLVPFDPVFFIIWGKMALSQHLQLHRALETVARDRHIKSLQYYDDISIGDDEIPHDELQASAKFHKNISDHSKRVIHLAEVLQALLSKFSAPHISFDEDAEILLLALQEAKKSAKALAEVDNDADKLLQGGTPPRDITRRRHYALSHVVASIWNVFEELSAIENRLTTTQPRAPQQHITHDTLSHSSGAADEDIEDDGETLEEIAMATGFTVEALQAANPSLVGLRGHDVVPVGTSLRLPSVVAITDADRASAAAAIAAVSAFERASNASIQSDRHRIREGSSGQPELIENNHNAAVSEEDTTTGETLADIAAKTGVSLRTLEELNQEIVARYHPTRDVIPIGTPVRIPEAAALAMSEQITASSSSRNTSQATAPSRIGVVDRPSRATSNSSRRLASHNHHRESYPTNSSRGGSYTDGARSASSQQRKHRTTATAQTQSYNDTETLADIAKATDVTIAELRFANPSFAAYGDHTPLPPDTKLIIPSFTSSSEEDEDGRDVGAQDEEDDDAVVRRLSATKGPDNASAVSTSNRSSEDRGDTLAEVAALYGTTVDELVEHNPQLSGFGPDDFLPVGLSIQIPSGVHHSRSSSRQSAPPHETVDAARRKSSASTTSSQPKQQQQQVQSGGKHVEDIVASGDDTPPSTSSSNQHHQAQHGGVPTASSSPPPHTIASLANALGVSEEAIRLWNPFLQHVGSDQVLAAGCPIRIPTHNSSSRAPPTDDEEETANNDTVSSVVLDQEDDHGVDIVASVPRHQRSDTSQSSLSLHEAVQKHRPLPSALQAPGQTTATSSPKSAAGVATPAASTTLAMIAAEFSLTTQQIRRLNPHLKDLGDDALIPPFTSLLLPKKPDSADQQSTDGSAPLPSSASRGASPVSTSTTIDKPTNEDQPSQRVTAPRGVSEGQKSSATDGGRSSTYFDDDDDEDDGAVVHEDAPAARGSLAEGQNILSGDEGPAPLANPPIPAAAAATPRASLITIAQTLRVSVEELRELNPKLRQYPEHLPLPMSANVVVPSRSTSLKSHQSTTSLVTKEVHAVPPRRVVDSSSDEDDDEQQQPHLQQPPPPPPQHHQETLASVSERYNIPISIIRDHNPSVSALGKHDPIPASTALKLPLTAAQRQKLVEPSTNPLSSVATSSQRASSIGSTGSSASTNHQRHVRTAGSTSPNVSPSTPATLIRPNEHLCTGKNGGDTLKSIALKYHVSVTALRHLNPAFQSCDTTAALPAGITLQIPHVHSSTIASNTTSASQHHRPSVGGRTVSQTSARSEGRVSTIVDDDEQLREATPRDTLYSDASRIHDERLLYSEEETMTSPNHSARLLASEAAVHNNSTVSNATTSQHHHERTSHTSSVIVQKLTSKYRHEELYVEDSDEEVEDENDGQQAAHVQRADVDEAVDEEPEQVDHVRQDIHQPYFEEDESFQQIERVTIKTTSTAQEKDESAGAPFVEGRNTALEGVAMIRAGGESIQQLVRRLQLREPELRAENPQLQHYHHTKPLPNDMLIAIPRASVVEQQPANTTTRRAAPNHENSAAAWQQQHQAPKIVFVDPQSTSPAQSKPSVSFVSKNAPKTWESDGMTTVSQVCTKFFVREDVLREWNPFLRRYHSKTVVPPGATIYLEPRPLENRAHEKKGSAVVGGDSEGGSDGLPLYVKVEAGVHVSLKTIALRHHLHEGGIRKLNPHVTQFPFDALLPAGTAVCVRAPALTRWESRIPNERIASVKVLESKCNGLIRQRYFLNWKALCILRVNSKEVEQAELKDERDQLHEQVAIGKMCEADLRRRVTELRMVVDSMRGSSPTRYHHGSSSTASSVIAQGIHSSSSPVRNISPYRNAVVAPPPASYNAFVSKSVDRAASLVDVAGVSGGGSPARVRLSRGREISPMRRTPVVADVGGVAWMSQPERVQSISPVRAASGTRTLSPSAPHHQLRLVQAVAQELFAEHSTSPAPASTTRATISPRRGQKPSLGLMLSGLRIAGVTGSAEAAGIRVNDAVLRVDGKLVSNAVSFRDSVARAPGPRVCITVQHAEGGSTAFMLPLYPPTPTSSTSRPNGSTTSSAPRTTSPNRRLLSKR